MKLARLLVPGTLALLSLCFAPAVHAQTPARTYAVLSLTGNAITVHTDSGQVGLKVETRNRKRIDVEEKIFDQSALLAADRVIKSMQPGARPVLMMTDDRALYEAQNAMFDAPAANLANRDYLQSLLKDRGVTHLLLVTSKRDNANFALTNGHAGNGVLEGLGFFVDEMFITRNNATLEQSTGMVVPFAYVQVRLLDASTLEQLAIGKALKSRIVTRPAASSKARELWSSMPNSEKIGYLNGLLECAMAEVLPGLLGSADVTGTTQKRCQ